MLEERKAGRKMNIPWNLDLSGARGSSFSAAERLHITPERTSTWTYLLPFFLGNKREKPNVGGPGKEKAMERDGPEAMVSECQLSSLCYRRLCTVRKSGGSPMKEEH